MGNVIRRVGIDHDCGVRIKYNLPSIKISYSIYTATLKKAEFFLKNVTMPFASEKEFENHIRDLIKKYILPKDKSLILFDNKKAVDILICRNGKKAALYFLEIKYHRKSHGRLSTGHGKGVGFQPEILSKLPTYFETNMRWILGVEDIEGYYLLKNSKLLEYVSGGQIGTKYNNIQTKLFKHELYFNKSELIQSLKDWLIK